MGSCIFDWKTFIKTGMFWIQLSYNQTRHGHGDSTGSVFFIWHLMAQKKKSRAFPTGQVNWKSVASWMCQICSPPHLFSNFHMVDSEKRELCWVLNTWISQKENGWSSALTKSMHCSISHMLTNIFCCIPELVSAYPITNVIIIFFAINSFSYWLVVVE